MHERIIVWSVMDIDLHFIVEKRHFFQKVFRTEKTFCPKNSDWEIALLATPLGTKTFSAI